jgi:uncharacterized paraquat-inducible protein A
MASYSRLSLSTINYKTSWLYFISIEYYSSVGSLAQNILSICIILLATNHSISDVWLTCKGICERHKALKPSHRLGGRYSAGQKRCQTCALFIKWDGLWCPCCSSRLRANPRNTVDRRRTKR